jgi:hypothetical protein
MPRKLFYEAIVLPMMTNPKPDHIPLALHCQCAIVKTHTDGPETADLLQMQ